MKKVWFYSPLFLSMLPWAPNCMADAIELWEMSLAELMQVKVEESASLTRTNSRLVPASVTVISAHDISLSSARSLNELLEIHVPGLQYIDHHWGFSHLGARGVMSDRDDKYLLLINGRTMNDRTVVGSITERDLPMLGDIHHIDVIRGPGAATYGLGAVAMVINIVTFDDKTFMGHESMTRVGTGEEYISQEYKYSTGDRGDAPAFFFYTGISDFNGAHQDDAPFRFSRTVTIEGQAYAAESDIRAEVRRDKAQYRDLPKVKIHSSLRSGDWQLSARYTRGGEEKSYPVNAGGVVGLGSQQVMLSANYLQTIDSAWQVSYDLNVDSLDYERDLGADLIQSYREDELLARAIAHWEPQQASHSAAIGVEAAREKFGLDSPGFPHDDVEIPGLPKNSEAWYASTYSVFAEHQWNMSPQWTLFEGARIDKNTYTHPLVSPRLAIVYSPWGNDTFKYLLSRSQRMNFAVDTRKEYLATGTHDTAPEKLDSFELIWNHHFGGGVSSAVALYKEYLDLIGYPHGLSDQQLVIAEEKQSGLEVELSWQTDEIKLSVSHAYTHLDDIKLINGVTSTFVSTGPDGYGDSLNNWSNHLTKLYASYQYSRQWVLHGSLVYYWEFDGMRDDMTRQADANPDSYDYGNNDEAAGSNIYLNLGANLALNRKVFINFAGHNLLGLVDESYNKRNYFAEFGDNYRLQAASLDVTFNMKFF